MTTINPILTFNCTENWDNMKIGLVSRYCENCKRDVQDFTTQTREEILKFLLINRSNKVCGRIFKSQLDYHHDEILITIESYIKKNKNSNLSFYLLSIGATILLGCSSNIDKGDFQTNDTLIHVINGHQGESNKNETSQGNQKCKIDSLSPLEIPIVGDIKIDDSLVVNSPLRQATNGVRTFAEVMPEFIGGFDSLVTYIKNNLKYPEWEREAKIQGNVYVSFTVDKDGEIIDPKILKTVSESKNFDNEVIRIVKTMPKWKPGQEKGENVAVQFVLPIRFKL